MKVLVVEDDPAEMQRLKNILESLGHQVLCARRGAMAFQTAVAEQPEMVIIKTVLPDMRGMELFYRLRTHPILREMIVMLSNPQPTDNEVLEGFCLHSDFHWQRPLDTADLTKVMQLLAPAEENNSPRFQDMDFTGSWPNTFTEQNSS